MQLNGSIIHEKNIKEIMAGKELCLSGVNSWFMIIKEYECFHQNESQAIHNMVAGAVYILEVCIGSDVYNPTIA